jgi:hypothetical protein
MSLPFTNFNIELPLEVMSTCLQRTNESYQRLLSEPDSLELCTEAGKSLRLLSRRYSQVLIAVVESQSDSDLDDDWDKEEGRLIEEELED